MKRDVEWDCGIHVEPMLIESKFFPEVKWEDKEPLELRFPIGYGSTESCSTKKVNN